MVPDYDLSKLPASQFELCLYVQVDAIFGQIMADQAERLGFPLAPRNGAVAALTEKPAVTLNSLRLGADPWARLRKLN